jgi:DNA-binding NarL/FixJ family response regulator
MTQIFMQVKKTILLDQQNLFTECLAACFEQTYPAIDVIASYRTGKELLESIKLNTVDLLMLDLNLPDYDGIELIPQIRKENKNVKILVLTTYSKSKFVKGALQKGADGYILKDTDLQGLMSAIDQIFEDETYIGEGLYITPPSHASKIKKEKKSVNGMVYEDKFTIREKLTKREIEILKLIAEAKNNKEIASELFISDQTVGVHRKNMMKKLGVHNTVNLVKLALEYQLVE